jgi:hypothetical protein
MRVFNFATFEAPIEVFLKWPIRVRQGNTGLCEVKPYLRVKTTDAAIGSTKAAIKAATDATNDILLITNLATALATNFAMWMAVSDKIISKIDPQNKLAVKSSDTSLPARNSGTRGTRGSETWQIPASAPA